jgi:hypothetical protein
VLAKPNWERSLERWRAFWAGGLADRPPVIAHLVATRDPDPGPTPSEERLLDIYDPARNAPVVAAQELAVLARAHAVQDDMPPAVQVGGGVWFTGAIFGAPLRATADMLATDPIVEDWETFGPVRLSPQNPWLQRTLALAEQLVARSGGRYAVTPGLIEGPSDICANLRGPTPLAEDLYAHPREAAAALEQALAAWLAYADALHRRIPLYDGGTATQWALWAPGRAGALQEDFCTLLSPRQFRQWVLPLDREVARSLDLCWMHLHAGQVHLVDEVLTAEEIRGVQIVHDGVASPPLPRMIAAMQRVQRAGRCLILRKYAPDELAEILPQLSPRGLAIDTYFASAEEANAWLDAAW